MVIGIGSVRAWENKTGKATGIQLWHYLFPINFHLFVTLKMLPGHPRPSYEWA